MDVARIVKALQKAGIDADATSIADMIWLAHWNSAHAPVGPQRAPGLAEPAATHNVQPAPDEGSAGAATTLVTAAPTTETSREPVAPATHSPAVATTMDSSDVFVRGGHTDGTKSRRAHLLRVPGTPALPDSLGLARALRPFLRRMPSATHHTLDEAASAELSAELGSPMAVMSPTPERMFDVALVVEDARGMAIWERTLAEWERLLLRHGAFRDVRSWKLRWRDDNPELVDAAQAVHPWQAVRQTQGHRLILIATDGVSAQWRDGKWKKLLDDWTAAATVTIVQVLGARLAERTALGPPSVSLTPAVPGTPNRRFTARVPTWQHNAPATLNVPMVYLERSALARWSRAVVGASAATQGVAIGESAKTSHATGTVTPATGQQQAEPGRALRQFLQLASPEARQLAISLSAVPLTLPVMRLIQRVTSSSVRHEHLAEVMLGGIIERVTPANKQMPADEIEFDFVEDVRDQLQAAMTRAQSERVLSSASRYVADRYGHPLDFKALIESPDGDEVLPEGALPFARFAQQVKSRFAPLAPLPPMPADMADEAIDDLDEESEDRDTISTKPSSFDPSSLFGGPAPDDYALVIAPDYTDIGVAVRVKSAAVDFLKWARDPAGGKVPEENCRIYGGDNEIHAEILGGLKWLRDPCGHYSGSSSGPLRRLRRAYVYVAGYALALSRGPARIVFMPTDQFSGHTRAEFELHTMIDALPFDEVILIADLEFVRTNSPVKALPTELDLRNFGTTRYRALVSLIEWASPERKLGEMTTDLLATLYSERARNEYGELMASNLSRAMSGLGHHFKYWYCKETHGSDEAPVLFDDYSGSEHDLRILPYFPEAINGYGVDMLVVGTRRHEPAPLSLISETLGRALAKRQYRLILLGMPERVPVELVDGYMTELTHDQLTSKPVHRIFDGYEALADEDAYDTGLRDISDDLSVPTTADALVDAVKRASVVITIGNGADATRVAREALFSRKPVVEVPASGKLIPALFFSDEATGGANDDAGMSRISAGQANAFVDEALASINHGGNAALTNFMPADPETALEPLCEFLQSFSLALHMSHLGRDPGWEQQMPYRFSEVTLWDDETFRFVKGQCEWLTHQCIREFITPLEVRLERAFRHPSRSSAAEDGSLPDRMERASILSQVLLVIGLRLRGLQAESPARGPILVRPDLHSGSNGAPMDILRLVPEIERDLRTSDSEAFFSGDPELGVSVSSLAAVYEAASNSLVGDIVDLIETVNRGKPAPQGSALTLLQFLDRFPVRDVLHNARFDHEIKLFNGVSLSDEQINDIVSIFDPGSLFQPRWLASREEWASHGLCTGDESGKQFCLVLLDTMLRFMRGNVAAFDEAEVVSSGYTMSQRNWEISRRATVSGMQAKLSNSDYGTGELQVQLSGRRDEWYLTLHRTIRVLAPHLRDD